MPKPSAVVGSTATHRTHAGHEPMNLKLSKTYQLHGNKLSTLCLSLAVRDHPVRGEAFCNQPQYIITKPPNAIIPQAEMKSIVTATARCVAHPIREALN